MSRKKVVVEDKELCVRLAAAARHTLHPLPKTVKRVYLRYDHPKGFRGMIRWYIWWKGGVLWFEDAQTANRSRWCCDTWLEFNGWIEDANDLYTFRLSPEFKKNGNEDRFGLAKFAPDLQLPRVEAGAVATAGRLQALPA